jgi:Family of unknown function (DUF5996)
MFSTFDLRDIRLGGTRVPAEGANAGYIRRNALDEEQFESGWWPGSPSYPRPAFCSFTHPRQQGIAQVRPRPQAARWHEGLGEFLLDYDDVRRADSPEEALRAFLDSTYEAGAALAGWDPAWICSGLPEPAPNGEAS